MAERPWWSVVPSDRAKGLPNSTPWTAPASLAIERREQAATRARAPHRAAPPGTPGALVRCQRPWQRWPGRIRRRQVVQVAGVRFMRPFEASAWKGCVPRPRREERAACRPGAGAAPQHVGAPPGDAPVWNTQCPTKVSRIQWPCNTLHADCPLTGLPRGAGGAPRRPRRAGATGEDARAGHAGQTRPRGVAAATGPEGREAAQAGGGRCRGRRRRRPQRPRRAAHGARA
jgi:hypothetical protein